MKGMAKTDPVPRPRTRADCSSVPRPCPYVGCRYNLYLDVNEMSGTLKLNFPDLEPWEMPPLGSCVLDIAERQGALSLEDTGGYLNLTRERVRQIQTKAEWRMGPLVRRSL